MRRRGLVGQPILAAAAFQAASSSLRASLAKGTARGSSTPSPADARGAGATVAVESGIDTGCPRCWNIAGKRHDGAVRKPYLDILGTPSYSISALVGQSQSWLSAWPCGLPKGDETRRGSGDFDEARKGWPGGQPRTWGPPYFGRFSTVPPPFFQPARGSRQRNQRWFFDPVAGPASPENSQIRHPASPLGHPVAAPAAFAAGSLKCRQPRIKPRKRRGVNTLTKSVEYPEQPSRSAERFLVATFLDNEWRLHRLRVIEADLGQSAGERFLEKHTEIRAETPAAINTCERPRHFTPTAGTKPSGAALDSTLRDPGSLN
jgi:hypothetical protein